MEKSIYYNFLFHLLHIHSLKGLCVYNLHEDSNLESEREIETQTKDKGKLAYVDGKYNFKDKDKFVAKVFTSSTCLLCFISYSFNSL